MSPVPESVVDLSDPQSVRDRIAELNCERDILRRFLKVLSYAEDRSRHHLSARCVLKRATAGNWLLLMMDTGELTLVSRGSRGKASEYRFHTKGEM